MTELAQRAEAKLPVQLVGRMTGLDEAYRLAANIAQSGLVPDSLQNKPNNVLVTILYGQELGLRPMQAIQTIHVIKGKPFISGQLWLSLVRKAGHKAVVSGDATSATCTITRGDDGQEHTETFTLEQARTAKLTGASDSNWTKYPDRMLRWRSVTNCARMICPEVALGFQSDEERDDEPAVNKPSLAQVAQQRDRGPEVHDAEVVEDDAAIRAQVERLQAQHTAPANVDTTTGEVIEPDEALLAEMAAEMAPDRDDTAPSGLFGGE